MPHEPSPPLVPVVARPAAAVVALRDGDAGMEVLVGQRTSAARFMGGFWVFPGGRVETTDGPDELGFRRAAARELHEEAGVVVDADALVPFDRWLTPEPLPHRFDTVFFLAEVPAGTEAQIDGQEIVDSRWATPDALLRDCEAGVTQLSFPTLRQLEKLVAWPSASAAVRECAGRPFPAPVAPTPGDGLLSP